MRALRGIIAVLLLAGIAYFAHERRDERLVARVMAKPDRLRVYRISNPASLSKQQHEALMRGPHILEFPIIYGVEVRDRSVIDEAAALVRDPRNYPQPRPGEENTCDPNPGIAFQFLRGREHVEVVMCFRCGELWIHPTGWGYFIGMRPMFAHAVHRALPKEAAFDVPEDADDQRRWDPYAAR